MSGVREAVWRANLSLAENRLVAGTQGNVSARAGGAVYIKPSGVPYDELTAKMIVRIGPDGRPGAGSLKPSVDTPHHRFLYAELPEAGGICHTHSKFISVFSVLGLDIPVLTTGQADVFGAPVPVTGYVDNRAEKIGRAVLEAYRRSGCPAVVIGRHGLFTIAPTAGKAAFYALMAESCAEIAWHALVLGEKSGRPVTPLGAGEIEKWHGRYHSDRYGQR